jgi:hypothetical protein
MGNPRRFDTGIVSADARLLRLEALANQPSDRLADGLALEDWIDDVLREMRGLPHDLLRRLKPEALYAWDSPRKWDMLRIRAWHMKVATDLRKRLAELIDPRFTGAALPADISASIGVTHSYRHYLGEGLAGVYGPGPAEIPEAMLQQVARIAAAGAEAPKAGSLNADEPAK